MRVELVGGRAAQRGYGAPAAPAEGIVRLAAWAPTRAPLEIFRKLAPTLILSGPPGLAVTGGAPPVSEVVAYWPALVPREAVTARVQVLRRSPGGAPRLVADEAVRFAGPTRPANAPAPGVSNVFGGDSGDREDPEGPQIEAPLGAIAHARSGDKGDAANIGVIARSPACFRWLDRHLTAERVAGWSGDVATGPVTRYRLPGLEALNFVLDGALGGGGSRSLYLDPQGKTLAQGFLRRRVRIPAALLATIPPDRRALSPSFAPEGGVPTPAAEDRP